jgi:hypothetical protein
MVGANLIFVIIVAVWAGKGPEAHIYHRYAAAVAFSVFDFLINVGMIVWTFVGNREENAYMGGETTITPGSGGGFQSAPVTSV